ncbi:MAG: hypothetical protein RLN81_13395 [Balneolaceae bacterium]
MISEKVHNVFALLENSGVKYYLLRPIDLKKEITDIDLVIPREDFKKLLLFLKNKSSDIRFKFSPYNHTIKLFIDDLILDIQFFVAFLPRKSLILNKQPEYSTVSHLKEHNLIVPEVSSETLFTLWTFRFLLDKEKVSDSDSFKIYKQLYEDSWHELSKSDYFSIWLSEIFGNQIEGAKKLIISFFENDFNDQNGKTNIALQSLLFQERHFLKLKYMFDQMRFRLLRVLGKYSKFHPLDKLL